MRTQDHHATHADVTGATEFFIGDKGAPPIVATNFFYFIINAKAPPALRLSALTSFIYILYLVKLLPFYILDLFCSLLFLDARPRLALTCVAVQREKKVAEAAAVGRKGEGGKKNNTIISRALQYYLDFDEQCARMKEGEEAGKRNGASTPELYLV